MNTRFLSLIGDPPPGFVGGSIGKRQLLSGTVVLLVPDCEAAYALLPDFQTRVEGIVATFGPAGIERVGPGLWHVSLSRESLSHGIGLLELVLDVLKESGELRGQLVVANRAEIRLQSELDVRLQDYLRVTDSLQAQVAELQGYRVHLEQLVVERTADLQTANTALLAEKARQEELIGELAEAHSQLLQSEKLASIGQLAAGVAHELNNPIGFANSNLGTLQRYVADLFRVLSAYEQREGEMTPETQAVLTDLKRQIDLAFLRDDASNLLSESIAGLQRIKRIVQDLKDFSQVDQTEKHWANLEKGLDSTLNVVWNELKYKAEVVKEYGGIGEIECVPSQLNQVFLNLLTNAVHAIENHGRITVRTGQDDESVWVDVEDTGRGIEPQHLDRIFDPFFTTKPVGAGIGLGLSLSYGIVQQHGGRIEVNSAPGKGSHFRVVLPRHAS